MKSLALTLALMLAAACGEDHVAFSRAPAGDYNQAAVETAVNQFVTDGRTPQAFADLFRAVLTLRPGMDRSVGKQAELKLVVLALAPLQAVQAKPMAEQVDALAVTVWPALLSPRIEADEVLLKRDPDAALLQPRADEDARAYLQRLCGGPLAGECKQAVPELQGSIVAAVAIRRGMERARNAVSDCVMCASEPGWHDAVRAWESLDRAAHAWLPDVERRARPDNWPIAGNAAETGTAVADVTALWREAEVNDVGEVVIGGQRYLGAERVAALRDLRGDSDTLALHLRPELSLAQVKGVLADTAKSGARKVAVVARAPEYPWDRRIYWLALDGSTRVGLRPTDSLQLLLHTLDHVASPGAIARVD